MTAREAEVLALIARHFTNAEIADALSISTRTVETHVSALLRKLNVADRRGLARSAGVSQQDRRPLPVALTSFVGRAIERAELGRALAEHRMVTAIGPGGVGKTRLALTVAGELASGLRHGAWFVDLAHVSDPAAVALAIAQVIGVPEQHTLSTEQAVVAVLAAREALLVLDNCEHVLDGVRESVERILAGCPEMRVLATSRTRLLTPFEYVYPVPALSGEDAVALFAARVSPTTGGAPALDAARVAALCGALDGIALAIELAAARFPTLGIDGLEAGLDERLRFLAGGARLVDRHRSLRDAIAWSYDLLSAQDRALLRGVSVFASWFDVAAADAVVSPGLGRAAVADGLARLAEDSLLLVEPGGPTRYRALETIRQFGAEQLVASGELDRARKRYVSWICGVVAQLRGLASDSAWSHHFDGVADDISAAVDLWAEEKADQAAELAADLAGLLFLRGRPAQAQRRYEQAAELASTPVDRVAYLRLAAGAAASRFVGTEALRLFRAAAQLAAAAGDEPGAALDLAMVSMYIARTPGIMSEPQSPADTAPLLEEAARLSDGSPRVEAALAVAAAFAAGVRAPATAGAAGPAVALAERSGDAIVQSIALDLLSSELLATDDIAGAMAAVRRRAEVMRTLPVSAASGFEHSDFQLMASDVALAAGALVEAREYADALARLPFYRDEDHLAVARRLRVDTVAGALAEVVADAERFRLGWERAGRPVAPNLGASAYAVSTAHGMLGDDDRRAAWLRTTVELGIAPERLAGCGTGWAPVFDALLELHRGDAVAAVRRLDVDVEDVVWRSWAGGLWRPWYAALWAEAATIAGHPDAADRITRARRAARDNPIATAMVDRAAAFAASDHDALVPYALTFAQLGCPYQQARTGKLAAALR